MPPDHTRMPESLWAAVTPPGPELPRLEGSAAGRRRHHRRRLHRALHRAASARGRRRCRHHRGRRARLWRLGPQQRPGDPDADAARSGRHRQEARRQPASALSRCCATALPPCSMSRGATRSRPSRSRPAGSSRCIRPAAWRSPSGGCGNGPRSAPMSKFCRASKSRRCSAPMPGSAASGTGPAATSIRWRCRAGWRAPCSIAAARIFARSPASRFERKRRPLDRHDAARRDQRPRADPRHQCLYRRIRQSSSRPTSPAR